MSRHWKDDISKRYRAAVFSEHRVVAAVRQLGKVGRVLQRFRSGNIAALDSINLD